MKQLAGILDDLTAIPTRRDRWGRYLVVPKKGAKPVGYTRATTVAKALDDSGGLLSWGKRMVALGLAQRPDLVALAATTADTDKRTLDDICERAAEAGGATIRRDLGTALHAMLESSWADPTFVAPDPYGSDVAAVHDALATARLRVVDGFTERMVVHHLYKIAGTFDLLLEDEEGNTYIADIKTGSSLLGALAFAVQLSIYASADSLYTQGAAADGSEDTETPMVPVSAERGVIIHVQPGSGVCALHWIDLTIGAAALELAIAVREMRKAKPLTEIDLTESVVERTKKIAAAEKVMAVADGLVDDEWRAWMTGRLKTLIDAGHADLIRSSWPEGVPTLGSGKPIANHLTDPIEQAVSAIERHLGAEFPEPKPTEQTDTDRPVARRSSPEEGAQIDTAHKQAITKRTRALDPEARAWIGAVIAAAKKANRPINISGPGGKATERRFAIASALIVLSGHGDDELARALVGIAMGEELQPAHDLGDAIGALTIDEANRLGHLVRALDAGSLVPGYEEGFVVIHGDIQAAIAA